MPYLDVFPGGSEGGGSVGTVDTTARALARVVTGESGESVAAGKQVFVDGQLFANNTSGALVIPSVLTEAEMELTGFEAVDLSAVLESAETYYIPSTDPQGAGIASPAAAEAIINASANYTSVTFGEFDTLKIRRISDGNDVDIYQNLAGSVTLVDTVPGSAGNGGLGWTGGTYDSSTGFVTFSSDDGLGFVTGDLRGANGSAGAPGTAGNDGVGISTVTVNASNEVTVTLTDNTVVLAGTITIADDSITGAKLATPQDRSISWTEPQVSPFDTLAYAAAIDDDTDAGSVNQRLLLTGNVTTLTLSGGVDGQSRRHRIVQDVTGGWTITFSGIGGTEPIINSSANAVTDVWYERVEGVWQFVMAIDYGVV